MSAKRERRDDPPLPPFALPATHVVIEIKQDPARPGGRLVLQDGVESSYVDVRDPKHLQFEYLRHLARVIDVLHPRRLPLAMAQVGGGPCSLGRFLDATRRDLRATVIERDPEVVAIAREWLGLRTSSRLEVRIGEGRETLQTFPDGSLDVLVVDAFDGVVVPHHLTTLEFILEARRTLRPDGFFLVNVIDLPPLGLVAGLVSGLSDVYASVAILADDATLAKQTSGNIVVIGSDRDIPLDQISRLAARDPTPWQLVWGRALRQLLGDAVPLRDGTPPDHSLATLGMLWGRASSAQARVRANT